MNRQLKLFEEVRHLEADCWFSGTPDIPDPYDGEEWLYNNDAQASLFYGELAYNGELVSELGKVAVDGE